MDNMRRPDEAPLTCLRDAVMEELPRRPLCYPSRHPHYWTNTSTKAVALGRFKPAISKKKDKESFKREPVYKEKYGSVSAHSTSAIYGALRAPHYHALYGPTDMWYASVRSLNRGIHRNVFYRAEAYEWRETAKEVFAVGPQVEMIPLPSCMCMVRRQHSNEGSIAKGSRLPRCKICTPVAANGSCNGVQASGIPKRIKKNPQVTSEKHESTSRMSGYKKCVTGSKFNDSTATKMANNELRRLSRKSILEWDVTAYDLIKKAAPTPSTSSNAADSDIEDNINSDLNISRTDYVNEPRTNSSPTACGNGRQTDNKELSFKFKTPDSESCVYGGSRSVFVGGQRIFTDNPQTKSQTFSGILNSGDDTQYVNQCSSAPNWQTISDSHESVCIPDPDYDFSDDSDDSSEIISNFSHLKFTYSPPLPRKSSNDGLSYASKELSKSMSSLQYEDTCSNGSKTKPTCIPKLADLGSFEDKSCVSEAQDDVEHYRELPVNSPSPQCIKRDQKSETSSDCSSSGGTLSDYPTWVSYPNELRPILKNKKRNEGSIQEPEEASRVVQYFEDCRINQSRKQVQFRPRNNEAANKITRNAEHEESDNNASMKNFKTSENHSSDMLTSVINNTYESILEVTKEATLKERHEEMFDNKGEYVSVNSPFTTADDLDLPVLPNTVKDSHLDSYEKDARVKQAILVQELSAKLASGMSKSTEDISGGKDNKGYREGKTRGRNRSTLLKRTYSDLHLHLPPEDSGCGENGCGGDDRQDMTNSERAHRSLPESPREFHDASRFAFDFVAKKEKVLSSSNSAFYVPMDEALISSSNDIEKNTEIKVEERSLLLSCEVSEAKNERNLSPEGYDTDEDIFGPIYEELLNLPKGIPSTKGEVKSFFEGASKTDILSYLADAKERGLTTESVLSEDDRQNADDDDEDDSCDKNLIIRNNIINHKQVLLKIEEGVEKEEIVEKEDLETRVSKSSISEVERHDSGVGTEIKPTRMMVVAEDYEEQQCADCDYKVEPQEDKDSGFLFSPVVCRKCEFRRSERKETIIEFVDTEVKYGRDLRIIKDEFYRPMEIAGLLAKDQLLSIFLNLDELTAVNTKFTEKLQDALDIAVEHGDEDYTTVNIGKIFLEISSMLHVFETYCVKQASASVLLSNLEKEKELLRIFLRVSQMENTLLRRMNLQAFLMVPVQRVTRYPLLLSRLLKVTPLQHKDRNALKEAQRKVELHLEHINQQTKGVGGTKIWRRISNISVPHRRFGKDIGSIKLRKMALEILNWKQDEAHIVIAGNLFFTQITDYPWKKGKSAKFTPLHGLLIALGKPNSSYMSENDSALLFPRNTGIKNASLVLMKEKNSRFIVVRDPLYLGNCVISCESETDDAFEIQEYTTKEAYLLKGETKEDTKEWLGQLRYHAKDLGTWRKRRNALANIMIRH